MTRGRFRLVLAAATVAVAFIGLGAARADAHAELLATNPSDGAVLDASPANISLSFNESVEVSLGGIKLLDANAHAVKIGPTQHAAGDASTIEATLPSLANGIYVVSWRATSADSHPVFGAFTFRVGQGVIGDTNALRTQALSGGGASKAVGVGLGATRLATFAGVFGLIGAAGFAMRMWPAGFARRRLRQLLWTSIVVAAVGALAGVAFQGAYASGAGMGKVFDPSLWRAVTKTRFGTASMLRVGLLLVASALVLVVDRHRNILWRLAATATGALLLVTIAIAGHANTGQHPLVGMITDLVHLGAASLWIGGLAALLIALTTSAPAVAQSVGAAVNTPGDRALAEAADIATGEAGAPRLAPGPTRHELVTRFSRYAFTAVVFVVGSGVVQSWRQVDRVAGLWTGYGHILLRKLVVVAALLLVALGSRRAVRRWSRAGAGATAVAGSNGGAIAIVAPDALSNARAVGTLRRTVGAELAIGVAVLALTSVLVATRPGRESISGPVSVNLVSTDTQASLTIDPARHGTAAFHLFLVPPGGTLQKVKAASLQISLDDKGVGPIDISLDPAGPNHFTTENGFIPLPGRWTVTITALLGDFDSRRFTTTVNVT